MTFNSPVCYQESLADETAGRKAASVQKVVGAGHLVCTLSNDFRSKRLIKETQLVQQKPDALAESICIVLDTVPTVILPSKL